MILADLSNPSLSTRPQNIVGEPLFAGWPASNDPLEGQHLSSTMAVAMTAKEVCGGGEDHRTSTRPERWQLTFQD